MGYFCKYLCIGAAFGVCGVALAVQLSAVGCAQPARSPQPAAGGDPPSGHVVMPDLESISHMTLMLDEAWWLTVQRTGLSSIGYGALPQRAGLRPNGIALRDVYARIAGHVRRHEPRGESAGHWIGLVYSSVGGNESSVVFDIDADVYPSIIELFRRAYRDVDLRSPGSHSPEVIVRFWERAFFLAGAH